MTKQSKLTAWSKKKPPMVGEYNASISQDGGVRRWWNGQYWSAPYWPRLHSESVQQARRRLRASEWHASIQWRGLIKKPDYPFPPGPLEKL
jgi:hypothetical protein